MRSSLLYLATLSDLAKDPVFIWLELVPTAKSAINVSSLSPDLCEIIVLTPKSLTQDLKIELLDSLPPEVKTISFSFALIKEAIDFLAFSSKDLLSLP